MTQIVDKMAALNQRVEDLDKELAELQNRRDGLALDFSQGHKGAIKQCAQIDATMDAAKREMGLLTSALSQLEQLAQNEQNEILNRVERERQTKAAGLAAAITSLNSTIDTKLVEIRDLLASRADSLNQLRSLGVVDAMYINRQRDLPNGAFAAAGLAKFVNLHAPSPQAIRPLASSNAFFKDIGAKPPVERIKVNEDADV